VIGTPMRACQLHHYRSYRCRCRIYSYIVFNAPPAIFDTALGLPNKGGISYYFNRCA